MSQDSSELERQILECIFEPPTETKDLVLGWKWFVNDRGHGFQFQDLHIYMISTADPSVALSERGPRYSFLANGTLAAGEFLHWMNQEYNSWRRQFPLLRSPLAKKAVKKWRLFK